MKEGQTDLAYTQRFAIRGPETGRSKPVGGTGAGDIQQAKDIPLALNRAGNTE